MQQILQDVKGGELTLAEVPSPATLPGGVLVRTEASVISAGTEKMVIDLAKKSLVGKARSRPDLVRQVINKAKKEGLLNTYKTVVSRLERPMPLGYSAAGVVENVGEGVVDFRPGDRVAIAGGGYATHAEVNFVPCNLVARIPDGVSFQEAAYSTIGSIALQGVRIARPEIGDNIVVIGLGLIGLLTVQLLKANGCRVLGIDIDVSKADLARQLGADVAIVAGSGVEDAVAEFTSGYGADHVLITAGTDSSQPIELAGKLARRKGRVVAVGAVGLNVPRATYYEKELELMLSMSYGPGRYDPSYEEGGIDYPYDYVRWTENRNLQAFLSLVAEKKLNLEALTTHRFRFDDALDAYSLIEERKEPFVGVLLEYDTKKEQPAVIKVGERIQQAISRESLRVGLVGAGNYASLHILPHLKKSNRTELKAVVTATGLSARQKADKFGFEYCATDLDAILAGDEIDAVFIATTHSTHASYVEQVLKRKKHVFVEKPLVVTEDQLDRVKAAYDGAQDEGPVALMVGLNRRFSSLTAYIKDRLPDGVARQLIYRVNSGHIPASSWMHTSEEGGGMLVGEMCHFLDLMQYLIGERPVSVMAYCLDTARADVLDADNISIIVKYSGGSVGTLSYNTVGDKSEPKERLELYGGGCVAVLDDFHRARVTVGGKATQEKLRNQDKGQGAQFAATIRDFCDSGTSPIKFNELYQVMRTVFAARKSLQTGQSVSVV